MSGGLDIETTVLGGEEVLEQFRDCASEVRERIRTALFRIGQDVQAAAQGLAPVQSGDLRSSIRVRLSETASQINVSVGPGEFYARFLEFGTVSHGTSNNQALAGGKRAKVARVRALRAGGLFRIAPHPFMGPAQDEVTPQIDDILAAAVDEGVAAVGK